MGSVTIGKYSILAPDIFISSGNHFYKEKPYLTIRQQDSEKGASKELFRLNDKDVFIEEDCWIGKNVFIAPGVYVGRGAIIGTNSIVKSDIEPYTVNVGTPLMKVKDRLHFQPKEEISAFIPENLPYFYRGFKHYVPHHNILDVIIDDCGICSENKSIALLKNFSWNYICIDGFSINGGYLRIFIDGILYIEQLCVSKNEFKIKIDKNLILNSYNSDLYSFLPNMLKEYLCVQFDFESTSNKKYNFSISNISIL